MEGRVPRKCFVTETQRIISKNERSAMPDDAKRSGAAGLGNDSALGGCH